MSHRSRPRLPTDPWALVWGQPHIDSETLAAAIAEDLCRDPNPDYRTRLLVRDAIRAIRSFWGPVKFARWLRSCPAGERIAAVLNEKLGRTGFHHIRRRLVAAIGRDQVEPIFELLGRGVRPRVDVAIAGSIPTLIRGLTARPTDDIDFVNEVPREIRTQRAVLGRIARDYGLTLGHVQSHYLPARWADRQEHFGDFGGVRVYLVDPYDIFVSKLSSKQEKHRDDLRVMAPKLDKGRVTRRLRTDGKAFLENPRDRAAVEENWRFIYREALGLPPARL